MMTLQYILQALYSMALESAAICNDCEQYTYTYDCAIAIDGTLISIMVAASKYTTGIVKLICGNEQFETSDFNRAAAALHYALTYTETL